MIDPFILLASNAKRRLNNLQTIAGSVKNEAKSLKNQILLTCLTSNSATDTPQMELQAISGQAASEKKENFYLEALKQRNIIK